MSALVIELLPLILGNVLAPLWLIITLILLSKPGGLLKASGFVLGMTSVRVAQGVLFGFVFTARNDSDSGAPIASTLKLVLGILLLIAAYKKWRKEEDPDEPPPKWMQSLDQVSAAKAFGMGALGVGIGPKLWAFTLSAIAVIGAAELDQTSAILAFVAYIVFGQILLFLAILVAAVARQGSQALLQRSIAWLTTYNRPISVVVALIFGVLFTLNGITGLLSL